MFVWTVDGVITVIMLSLMALVGIGVGISVLCDKIAQAWRGRK